MIDTGLLISVVLLVAVPVVWARLSGTTFDGHRLTDVAVGPVVVGLVASRTATLLLDDPEALRSFRDAAVIRGGVDFWPGVLIALAVASWEARRQGVRPVDRLAAIAPFALVAYAIFEATCFIREGCFGPLSAVGIRPSGIQSTMFPLGWVVALVVAATAVGIHRTEMSPGRKLWMAASVIAGSRATVSFWLPRLGDGLTRAHQWSIGVTAALVLVAGVEVVRSIRGAEPAESPDASGPEGVVDQRC